MSTGVHVPEYQQDCELVAGEELARSPAFWLAHVLMAMGKYEEPAERYGVDAAEFDGVVGSADPEEPWPVFRVGCGGGHTVHAVYVNWEDGSSVDFFVRHPAWGRLGHLGQCGADAAGPGLAWTELLALAGGCTGGRGGADRSVGAAAPAAAAPRRRRPARRGPRHRGPRAGPLRDPRGGRR